MHAAVDDLPSVQPMLCLKVTLVRCECAVLESDKYTFAVDT